jgi:hypothetical protein
MIPSNQPFVPSTHTSTEAPADGPVTLSALNQMMSQFIDHISQQQKATVQQQVHAAIESTLSQLSPKLSSYVEENKAPIMSSPLPPKVKICQPSHFTGAVNRSAETWLFEMNKYLLLCQVRDEEQRVAIASSYLKDSALTWWRSRSKQVNPPSDWLAFTAAFKHRFQPLEASLTARARLYTLKQGPHDSLVDYNAKFENLTQLIDDMSEADQIYIYLRSIRLSIAKEIDTKVFKSLNEAMSLAVRTDTLLNNRHYSNYASPIYEPRPNSTVSVKTTTASDNPSTSTATAMELGNIDTSSGLNKQEQEEQYDEVEKEEEYRRFLEEGDNYQPSFDIWNTVEQPEILEAEVEQLQAIQRRSFSRVPNISREEFERCMKERLCLRCKKPNHIARDCPLRPLHPYPTQPRTQQRNRNF